MGTERFTLKFEEETIRQMVERCYSTAEISAHSLKNGENSQLQCL